MTLHWGGQKMYMSNFGLTTHTRTTSTKERAADDDSSAALVLKILEMFT